MGSIPIQVCLLLCRSGMMRPRALSLCEKLELVLRTSPGLLVVICWGWLAWINSSKIRMRCWTRSEICFCPRGLPVFLRVKVLLTIGRPSSSNRNVWSISSSIFFLSSVVGSGSWRGGKLGLVGIGAGSAREDSEGWVGGGVLGEEATATAAVATATTSSVGSGSIADSDWALMERNSTTSRMQTELGSAFFPPSFFSFLPFPFPSSTLFLLFLPANISLLADSVGFNALLS
mmetsp:Transcript_3766/g.5759  ORF Transcript_3766/g.5759 Transcript_3766/m.5759 type:complete len:232 (+) Transcript_3766:622-1317(+)